MGGERYYLRETRPDQGFPQRVAALWFTSEITKGSDTLGRLAVRSRLLVEQIFVTHGQERFQRFIPLR